MTKAIELSQWGNILTVDSAAPGSEKFLIDSSSNLDLSGGGSIILNTNKKLFFEGDADDDLNALYRKESENTTILTSRFNIANIIDANNDDTTSFWSVRHNGTTLNGSDELFRVTSTGRMGLATTDPETRFHLKGAGQVEGALIENNHNTTIISGNTAKGAFPHAITLYNSNNQGGATAGQNNNLVSIGFGCLTDSSHSNAAIVGHSMASSGDMDLAFYTEKSNTIGERFRIRSSGAITATSPTEANPLVALTNSSTAVTHGEVLRLVTGRGANVVDTSILRIDNNDGERLRVRNNGAVVLTGQSDHTLEIIGNEEVSGLTYRSNGARIIGPSSRRMYFELRGNDDTDHFRFLTSPNNDEARDHVAFHIGNNGTVGINEASPTRLLYISDSQTTAYSSTNGDNNAYLRLHNRDGTDNTGVNNHVGIEFYVGSGATTVGMLSMVRTGNNLGDFTYKTRTGASSYAEHLRITSGGRLNIGGLAASRINLFNGTNWTPQVQIESTSDQDSSLSLICSHPSNNQAGLIAIGATKASSLGGNGATGSSQGLGIITFQGNDGTNMVEAARVACVAAGSSSNDNVPGELRFSVNPGSGGADERMRIHKTGKVAVGKTPSNVLYGTFQVNQLASNDESGIGILSSNIARSMRLWCDDASNSIINSGDGGGGVLKLNEGGGQVRIGTGGLTFNGDTAAANALNDYEEGTLNWKLQRSNAYTGSNSVSDIKYTKIGNRVFVSGYLYTASTGAATGVYVQLRDNSNTANAATLPYTPNHEGGFTVTGTRTIDDSYRNIAVTFMKGSTTVYVYKDDGNNDYNKNSNNVQINIAQTHLVLVFNGSYTTDS